jgi:hypothetical protein
LKSNSCLSCPWLGPPPLPGRGPAAARVRSQSAAGPRDTRRFARSTTGGLTIVGIGPCARAAQHEDSRRPPRQRRLRTYGPRPSIQCLLWLSGDAVKRYDGGDRRRSPCERGLSVARRRVRSCLPPPPAFHSPRWTDCSNSFPSASVGPRQCLTRFEAESVRQCGVAKRNSFNELRRMDHQPTAVRRIRRHRIREVQ